MSGKTDLYRKRKWEENNRNKQTLHLFLLPGLFSDLRGGEKKKKDNKSQRHTYKILVDILRSYRFELLTRKKVLRNIVKTGMIEKSSVHTITEYTSSVAKYDAIKKSATK